MNIKPQRTFEQWNATDIGLRPRDTESHRPAFFIIRKSETWSHKDRHKQSPRAAAVDKFRRNQKKAAQAAANAAANG